MCVHLFIIMIYLLVFAFRAVKQDFAPSDNLITLMHKFTQTINLALTLMIEKKLTSRNVISKEIA